MIPSAEQDVDDLTLGEMLTAAYRGQVDYCVPGGMSVSQSSSSVMFDGSGQLDGERMVHRSGQPDVTLNVIRDHNNLSEDIRIEQTHDRTGQPDERNSSNAQIRTLLEEQRRTIIAEYREKVSHHELQAAHYRRRAPTPTKTIMAHLRGAHDTLSSHIARTLVHLFMSSHTSLAQDLSLVISHLHSHP